MDKNQSTYTCDDYREEMMLLGLKNRLTRSDLTEEERRELTRKIRRLEAQMGLD